MIDFSVARRCIKLMNQDKQPDIPKIGVLKRDVGGLTSRLSGFPDYTEEEVVLFYEHLDPSNSELRMGEYQGMKQKPTGFVTIESPLTQEEIRANKERGSSIKTYRTIVGVPKECLHEVRF